MLELLRALQPGTLPPETSRVLELTEQLVNPLGSRMHTARSRSAADVRNQYSSKHAPQHPKDDTVHICRNTLDTLPCNYYRERPKEP